MNRFLALLLLISLFFRCDSAYSIFGAGDVPLEDYYEFGRHQTGVASVQTKKIRQGTVKTSLGTANLIDVEDIGIPSLKGLLGALKGRVLITAAHVVDGSLLPEGASVRFIDENNESQKMDVKAVYAHQDYDTNCNDIGLIVLKQSVDTSKFKPLKLNLSKEEKSLSGELVNIFGCTPVFGKVNSNVVIRESEDTSLRRGMKTVVDNTTNESLNSYFYNSQGRVSIVRESIQNFTESDKEKKHTIEEELERIDAAVINVPQPSADHLILSLKRAELVNERSNLHTIEIRGSFSWEFYYNGNSIEDHLAMLEDTDDLDKSELISEWNKFINDKKPENKSLDLGIYRVNFYGPLPELSGQIYRGDSGGAWVIGDGEIVGVSKIAVCARQRESNFVKEKAPLTLSTNVSEYFSECERIISQSPPQDDGNFLAYSASKIWGYRKWIKSILREINTELVQSLPCSSNSWMF